MTGRYKIVDHYSKESFFFFKFFPVDLLSSLFSLFLVVEDGTQGLHFCRLEILQDTALSAEALEEAKALAMKGHELAE